MDFSDSTYVYQVDEDLQNMDNVSSEALFMIDCVGDTKLKSKFKEKDEPENKSKVKKSPVAVPSQSKQKKEKLKAKRVKEVNQKK